MNITAADKSVLLRLAASLPKGDETRRAILEGLKVTSKEAGRVPSDIAQAGKGIDAVRAIWIKIEKDRPEDRAVGAIAQLLHQAAQAIGTYMRAGRFASDIERVGASPEVDLFWKNFSALEQMSYFLGKAVASLLSGKISSMDKAWLEGTANRAHAERAKRCGSLRKTFKGDPDMEQLLPLLKLCQSASAAAAKSQVWSPAYDGEEIAKVVKKLLPLYGAARSKYPSAAHLLDAPG